MKYIIIFLLITKVLHVNSQIEILSNYDCPTSSYINSEKFMYYFDKGDLDSSAIILDEWIEKCGYREVTIRAQILLDFENNKNPSLNGESFNFLVKYIQRDTLTGINQKLYYEYDKPYYCYIPINDKYDKFTKTKFEKYTQLDSKEEQLLQMVYTGNHSEFYNILMSKDFEKSILKKPYLKIVNRYNKNHQTHYSFFTGIWIPLKNSTLGVHPQIGFQMGAKKNKWNYDLTLLFRFLKSKSEYEVYRKQNNQFEKTNQFLGGYAGLDFGYNVISNKSNEFQVTSGLGYDGFDALSQKGDLDAVGVGSYNFNFGFEFRRYTKNKSYYGINVKYNVVDYTISNKVDFNEYPISINFKYGLTGARLNNRNFYYY